MSVEVILDQDSKYLVVFQVVDQTRLSDIALERLSNQLEQALNDLFGDARFKVVATDISFILNFYRLKPEER